MADADCPLNLIYSPSDCESSMDKLLAVLKLTLLVSELDCYRFFSCFRKYLMSLGCILVWLDSLLIYCMLRVLKMIGSKISIESKWIFICCLKS